MARGIEGRAIYLDDEDRTRFLELLKAGLIKSGCSCHAWTLMSNHYHLLLQTGDQPLSDLMRPLNSRYAQYYARKHNRRGYLFQDRYKSVATQDQHYVREIIRYIHCNPVRSGICGNLKDLGRYRWSSHGVLMGLRECDFMQSGLILRRFGQNKDQARAAYRAFIEAGLHQPDEDIIKTIRMNNDGKSDMHNPGCWVIGDSEFVRNAMAADKANRTRLARYRKEGVTIHDLAVTYCHAAGITETELLRRSHKRDQSALRKLFAYLCRTEYGFPVVEIASYFGIDGSSASLSIQKGAEVAAEKQFEKQIISLRP